jgi:hypothetical protein
MLKPAMIALAILSACLGVLPADAQNNPGLRNGLPPTRMDSFVLNAGAASDQIYGDEGTYDIPPFFGFGYENRINAGITGIRDKGLTTGHGSMMPSATGADEFIAPGNPGGEWSLSGVNNGNPRDNGAGSQTYDVSGLDNQLVQTIQNLGAAQDQLLQAQNNLQAAMTAANNPSLTQAQQMAAQAAVQAAQQNVAGLQNSIASMNSSIPSLQSNLYGAESAASR